MAGPYSGTAGSVVINLGTAGTPLVGWITEWSLDKTRSTVETTSFGQDNATVIGGIKSASGSFSGSFDNNDTGQTALLTAFENGEYVGLRLYVSNTGYFNIGSALITNYSPTTTADGKADISYDFEANGSSAFTGS